MLEQSELYPTPGIPGVEATPGIELCVVVPTLNEAPNVAELIRRVSSLLHNTSWEMIFVDDDSTDGTPDVVRRIARLDRRIRCLHRIGRRGLASACVEGMLASSAPYLAVMDADLQHDETKLPVMLELLRTSDADLVVASRYTGGGGIGDWAPARASMSRLATKLSHLVCNQGVTDPMSGFFMIRREAFEASVRRLSTIGFKILLDLLSSSPRPLKVVEVPYLFGQRKAGESKLDSMVLWEFVMLLLDKTVGRYVPVRFISFAAVGATGVLVHMAALTLFHTGLDASFTHAQSGATLTAMIFNFWLNNQMTYRDMRLRGWSWLRGLATFSLACSIGALANVGIASYLFSNQTQWVLAALAGVAIGAVWNYAITQIYTWGKRK